MEVRVQPVLPPLEEPELALDLRQIDGEGERLDGLLHTRRALDGADHRDAVHSGTDHGAGVGHADAADADGGESRGHRLLRQGGQPSCGWASAFEAVPNTGPRPT